MTNARSKTMNLLGFLTSAQPAPSRASERFRQYEYTGNGLMKQRLLPAQQQDLNEKLNSIVQVRDTRIDMASVERGQALKKARDIYEAERKRIEDVHRAAHAKANEDYDAEEDALLAQFAAPLSREQIALLTTKPGEVVRVPAPGMMGNANATA
jgi:hypothetical protein